MLHHPLPLPWPIIINDSMEQGSAKTLGTCEMEGSGMSLKILIDGLFFDMVDGAIKILNNLILSTITMVSILVAGDADWSH
jgi:hypothetical protein